MIRNYDWPAIRLLFERGMSVRKIEKIEGMPTRQGVMKRAKAEGWRRNGEVTGVDRTVTPVTALTVLPRFSDPSPDLKSQIIDHLRTGKTIGVAARLAGRAERTVREWRQQDAVFAAYCDTAEAQKDASLYDVVYDGASRNPNLALKVLERRESTRGEWTKAPRGGGNKIEYVLNIHRGDDPPAPVVEVLDVTPPAPALTHEPDDVPVQADRQWVSQSPLGGAESQLPATTAQASNDTAPVSSQLRHDPLGRSR